MLLLDKQTNDETILSQQQKQISNNSILSAPEGNERFPNSTTTPKGNERFPNSTTTPEGKNRLSPFDPNTADSIQLLQLGLKPFLVRNICRYRRAGGIYQSKEDFAQLYGLSLGEYRRLEPYIRIADEFRPASLFVKRKKFSGQDDQKEGGHKGLSHEKAVERDTLRYPRKLQPGETIDLATADTSLLKRVPGIGSYYARRIVDYRKRLGGFASVGQLDEIESFPEEAKDYLRIDGPSVQRLCINRLSLHELRRHPYINYYQARAITDYRRLHGPIRSMEELQLLPDFPEEAIRRLAPYIEF